MHPNRDHQGHLVSMMFCDPVSAASGQPICSRMAELCPPSDGPWHKSFLQARTCVDAKTDTEEGSHHPTGKGFESLSKGWPSVLRELHARSTSFLKHQIAMLPGIVAQSQLPHCFNAVCPRLSLITQSIVSHILVVSVYCVRYSGFLERCTVDRRKENSACPPRQDTTMIPLALL